MNLFFVFFAKREAAVLCRKVALLRVFRVIGKEWFAPLRRIRPGRLRAVCARLRSEVGVHPSSFARPNPPHQTIQAKWMSPAVLAVACCTCRSMFFSSRHLSLHQLLAEPANFHRGS